MVMFITVTHMIHCTMKPVHVEITFTKVRLKNENVAKIWFSCQDKRNLLMCSTNCEYNEYNYHHVTMSPVEILVLVNDRACAMSTNIHQIHHNRFTKPSPVHLSLSQASASDTPPPPSI